MFIILPLLFSKNIGKTAFVTRYGPLTLTSISLLNVSSSVSITFLYASWIPAALYNKSIVSYSSTDLLIPSYIDAWFVLFFFFIIVLHYFCLLFLLFYYMIYSYSLFDFTILYII